MVFVINCINDCINFFSWILQVLMDDDIFSIDLDNLCILIMEL